MYKISRVSLLGLLLFLCSCHLTVNTLPFAPTDNYLLGETGIGSTIEEARSNALNLLAQNIFVQVSGNFSVNDKLSNNGDFHSTSSSNISLSSAGFFKDIVYSAPQNIGKDKYQVAVKLSADAIINTIYYLDNSLKYNLTDTLNDEELNQELTKANFLFAIILYAQSKSIAIPGVDNTKITDYISTLNIKLSNVAYVNFHVLPNLTNVSYVEINNTQYKANEPIALPPGLYYYTVQSNGYKPITNSIELEPKDKKDISIYLQQQLASPIKVRLSITYYDPHLAHLSLKEQVSTLAEKYQLSISDNSLNTLNVKFLPVSYTELDHYFYFNLPVQISLFGNEAQQLSKTFIIRFVGKTASQPIHHQLIIPKLDEFLSEITAGSNLSDVYTVTN